MPRRSERADVLGCLLLALSGAAWGQQQASARVDMDTAIAQQRRSLFSQRASLKRQVGDENFTAFLGTTFYGTVRRIDYLPVTYTCPPLETEKREGLIVEAARSQAIEPDLLRAVMHRESGYRPCAVSVKGARGLMQLMPATIAQFHVTDPFDPAQSVRAGAALLRTLLDKYQGDVRLALAAYNAGPARIGNTDPDFYPAETKSYIADILSKIRVPAGQPSP